MSISFYFYLFLIAVLSVVVSLGGSRWIERLYRKNKDILTFPDDVVSRGRWRPYLLGIAFLACGVRFFFLTSGLPLVFMLYAAALLLLMTATDFEQYCLFDEMMIPFALGGMVLCAMFTALVAVCSQIAVPMPWGVPINLALFAVYMAGTMLGPVWGTASQVVFIALAAIGVPVLANFQGGPSAIFGKTGGYAIGYILTALLTALLTKALGRKFWSLCVAMVVGCAACYVLGTIWFMILTGADLVSALGWCVLPYLPGDAVKIVLAAVLTMQLDKRLKGSLV